MLHLKMKELLTKPNNLSPFHCHQTHTEMASYSSFIATQFLILLVLHLSTLFTNMDAKHSSSATTHHSRHHHRSPPSASANSRLHQAYIALQAWKRVMYSDPHNFTANWVGPSVCNYTGVYCAQVPNQTHHVLAVAGIDLNFADIAGFLPDELGLLSDLALLHLSSNRFCGILPNTLSNLALLFELDLSNNRFVGPFPSVVLSLPSLYFLDIRYNEFEGALPSALFAKSLDAVFVNNNRFTSTIPSNLAATSSASVLVIANNNIQGCIPPSISNLANTLEELVMINTNISGCLPPEVGFLYKLRVLDVSRNKIVGPLPYSIAGLAHLEQLNLGHNMMSGVVPMGICALPNLANFTFSYNFFCEEEGICSNLTSRHIVYDDRRNCLPEKPLQRSEKECAAVLEHPVDCFEHPCSGGGGGGSGSGSGAPPAPPPSNHS